MCQFHMVSIGRRYLTNKPDLEAARELMALVRTLARKDQATFMEDLGQWYSRHEEILKEKSIDNFGKRHFTRPRLRSAYLSIKRHAPWLWTFERFKDRTMPNTNAGIESFNSRLKTTLRIHSGITAERRMKPIENFIATHYWKDFLSHEPPKIARPPTTAASLTIPVRYWPIARRLLLSRACFLLSQLTKMRSFD